MKSIPLVLLLAASVLQLAADDAPSFQLITLKDGSVIRAKVTEEADGFCMAHSPVIGDLKIPSSQVISIKSEKASGEVPAGGGAAGTNPSVPATAGLSSAGIDSLKSAVAAKVQSFASSSEGAALLTQFAQNQELRGALADPAVVKAIQSADYGALMKAPAIQKLMESPQTKALVQSILGSSGSGPKTDAPSDPNSR